MSRNTNIEICHKCTISRLAMLLGYRMLTPFVKPQIQKSNADSSLAMEQWTLALYPCRFVGGVMGIWKLKMSFFLREAGLSFRDLMNPERAGKRCRGEGHLGYPPQTDAPTARPWISRCSWLDVCIQMFTNHLQVPDLDR